MQTYMTRKSFHRTMRDLDDRRLINQFEEALHLLRVRAGLETAYANHPACKMWRGYEHALVVYVHSTTAERVRRFGDRYNRHRDGAVDPWVRMAEPQHALFPLPAFEMPCWWEDLRVHMSHRSNLLRKDPDFYRDKWEVLPEPNWPYLWPIPHPDGSGEYSLYISGPDKKRLDTGERVLPAELADKVVFQCP